VVPRRRDLGTAERAALAFGLSLALVVMLGLGLDKLPWGVRFEPIALALTTWTVALAAVAHLRRRRLPPSERALLEPDEARGWARSRPVRAAVALLLVTIVLASATLAVVLLTPPPPTTELYLLGTEGLAQDLPRAIHPGASVTVTVGVANYERRAASYRIVATWGGSTVGDVGPIAVGPDQAWERPLTIPWTLSARDEVPITIVLYKEDGTQPYRSVRLFLDVDKGAPRARP
jgi:uncharacterized membrane protein